PPAPPGPGRPGDADVSAGPGDHHGPGGKGTGNAEGDGKGTSPVWTVLDDAAFVQGMLGMQTPSDDGVSGGIPGGFGKKENAGAGGQVAWLALNLLWGKAVAAAKKLGPLSKSVGQRISAKVEQLLGREAGAQSAARKNLTQILGQRARQLELGADAAKGGSFIAAQGAGGVHMEQALGRRIAVGTHPGVDFVDTVLGPVSLKGPIPQFGSVEGLAASAIKDLHTNTATRTLVVDLTGLTAEQAVRVQNVVTTAVGNASKTLIFLR
ncbi:MAG: hypothetical protein ABI134_33085, partial [Byssovorax sp.]